MIRRLIASPLMVCLALPAHAGLIGTDAALQREQLNRDGLPAGGADIIGALLLVFIVLLITDIFGLTKVFPFTKPIR